jgi:EmrB/QacA subfamily drug resistance transporter
MTRKWLPLVAICLSTFMLLVDVTIVSVAVPSMARALDSSLPALQWTIDSYVLALAALLMAAGSASDRYGRRRFFLAGLVVFALSSLACGLAPGTDFLVAARAVQGAGAAAMFAANAALIAGSYTGRDRGTAFGVWGAVMGAAAAVGPILGGLLTEHLGWRAIFLVNLPVAVVAAALGRRTLTEPQLLPAARGDLPGAATFTLTATALVHGLIQAGDRGWTDSVTVASFLAALLFLTAFLVVESRAATPMLDLGLFRRPSFAALMLGGVALHAAAFGNLVLVSIWAQSVLGLGPVRTGLVLTPLAALSFATAIVGGRYLEHLPPRRLIGIGLVLVGAGTLLDLDVSTGSGAGALIAGLCVTGIGTGLASPLLVSATLASVPPQRAGMANGAITTFRQFGFALAVPVFATVIAQAARPVLAADPAFADPGGAAGQLAGGRAQALLDSVPQSLRGAATTTVHHAFAAGLDHVFRVSSLIAFVAGALVLLAPQSAASPAPAPVPTAPPRLRLVQPSK